MPQPDRPPGGRPTAMPGNAREHRVTKVQIKKSLSGEWFTVYDQPDLTISEERGPQVKIPGFPEVGFTIIMKMESSDDGSKDFDKMRILFRGDGIVHLDITGRQWTPDAISFEWVVTAVPDNVNIEEGSRSLNVNIRLFQQLRNAKFIRLTCSPSGTLPERLQAAMTIMHEREIIAKLESSEAKKERTAAEVKQQPAHQPSPQLRPQPRPQPYFPRSYGRRHYQPPKFQEQYTQMHEEKMRAEREKQQKQAEKDEIEYMLEHGFPPLDEGSGSNFVIDYDSAPTPKRYSHPNARNNDGSSFGKLSETQGVSERRHDDSRDGKPIRQPRTALSASKSKGFAFGKAPPRRVNQANGESNVNLSTQNPFIDRPKSWSADTPTQATETKQEPHPINEPPTTIKVDEIPNTFTSETTSADTNRDMKENKSLASDVWPGKPKSVKPVRSFHSVVPPPDDSISKVTSQLDSKLKIKPNQKANQKPFKPANRHKGPPKPIVPILPHIKYTKMSENTIKATPGPSNSSSSKHLAQALAKKPSMPKVPASGPKSFVRKPFHEQEPVGVALSKNVTSGGSNAEQPKGAEDGGVSLEAQVRARIIDNAARSKVQEWQDGLL